MQRRSEDRKKTGKGDGKKSEEKIKRKSCVYFEVDSGRAKVRYDARCCKTS